MRKELDEAAQLLSQEKRIVEIYDSLAKKDPQTIRSVYKKYKAMFDLASQILRFSYNFLTEGKLTADKISIGAQAVILPLYTQAFRIFRAIIIICRAGQYYEANILLRSFLDITSYLLYISENDQDERAEYYLHSVNLSLLDGVEKGRGILRDSELPANKKACTKAKGDALKYFEAKYVAKDIADIKNRRLGLTPHKAAEQLQEHKVSIERCRKIVYKTSSLVTHGESINPFGRLSRSENGEFEYICNTDPSAEMIDSCLRLSTLLFFFLIERINKVLGLNEDDYIETLNKKIVALFESETEKEIIVE